MRTKLVSLTVVALLGTAGCLGGIDSPASTTDTEQSGSYVSVTRVPQTAMQNASAAEQTSFEDLSTAKQDEFLNALNNSNVQATAWESGTEIQYVRYNDSWYQVEVHTV